MQKFLIILLCGANLPSFFLASRLTENDRTFRIRTLWFRFMDFSIWLSRVEFNESYAIGKCRFIGSDTAIVWHSMSICNGQTINICLFCVTDGLRIGKFRLDHSGWMVCSLKMQFVFVCKVNNNENRFAILVSVCRFWCHVNRIDGERFKIEHIHRIMRVVCFFFFSSLCRDPLLRKNNET